MSEKIIAYDLNDLETPIVMDRKEFYVEQVDIFKKTGKPTKAIEIVNVLVFNREGDVIIQKRSSNKAHNPNLLDKSVGGHVQEGDNLTYTVMVELLQELQTPSIVTTTESEFLKTRTLLKEHLETIAVVKPVDTVLFSPKKIINGEAVVVANKMHLYFAVYGGRVRLADKEAKGILFYSPSELENELKSHPAQFTDDLKVIWEKYKKEIEAFIKLAH
jgi:isopentenyldiphosphate isomerase